MDADADAQTFNAEGRRTRGTRRNAEKVVLGEGKGPKLNAVLLIQFCYYALSLY